MANGGTVFPPLGRSVPGVLDTPPVEVKCGLHSAAKGVEKNALAMSVVAYNLAVFDMEILACVAQQHSAVV